MFHVAANPTLTTHWSRSGTRRVECQTRVPRSRNLRLKSDHYAMSLRVGAFERTRPLVCCTLEPRMWVT